MILNKLKMAATVVLLAGLAISGVIALGLRGVSPRAEAAPQVFGRSATTAVQVASLVTGQSEEEPAVTYVDLQPKANQKLKEAFISANNFADNHLGELKPGKQTLEGFKFNIGAGMIYLANNKLKDKLPEKVEGIKVAAKFAELHILHATAYRDAPDTVIAKYIVRYDDKTHETIDVAYGQDVLDWWNYPGSTPPGRGKVAWTGSNEAAKGFEATLWLFAHTWKNPHPNKQVASIDFVSTLTDAAPFVVAMTLQGPTKDAGVSKDGVRFIRAGKFVQSLAYCDDGKSMAVVLWNGTPRADTEAGSVVLWDLGKGQLDQTLEKFEKELQYWRVSASRNGKIVAASATHFEKTDYGAIRVWDAAAGKVLRTFEFPAQVHGALALSPDGKKVAGGNCMTANGEVRVWHVQSAELLQRLQVQGMEYFALALSDDGKWIAGGGHIGSGRGKVVVWDLATGKVKHELTDNFLLTIAALEFSPDGKLLAGGGPNNSATWVWDMETGKVKHMLKDHEVKKLSFSPDGTMVATGGADHKVILWGLPKQKARITFEANTTSDRKQVIAHGFSPDGRTLAAGHSDGMIRFWPIPR